VLAACGSTGGGGSDNTWRHGLLVPKGDAGYLLMPQEGGFYEKHGSDVEVTELDGNVQLTQGLLAGELDSIESAPDPFYEAIPRGSDAKCIGSNIPGIAYAFYSRGDITSFQQFEEGSRIAVSAPGSFPEIVARAMLLESGVNPDSVELVNAGSDSERWQALVGGTVDGVANSAEFVPAAEGEGMSVLGNAWEIIPQYPRFLIWASGQALEEKPEAAVGFLAGTMEGIDYALTNREEALELTAKELDDSVDRPESVYMYDLIKEQGFASPTAEIQRDKLEWLLDLRNQLGLQQDDINLDEIIDESYREMALEEVQLQQTS